MKKIITLLFALVLLVGCGSNDSLANKTPDEQYKIVMDNTQNITSMEMDMDIAIDMIYGEESIAYDTSTNIKVEMNKPDYKMSMSMNVEDESFQIYVIDGYIYMDLMGMKIKTVMTDEVSSQYEDKASVDMIEVDFISNLESKFENDVYTITYDVDDSVLTDIINEAMGNSIQDLGADGNIIVENVSCQISFDKKGVINGQKMAFDIVFSDDENSMKIKYDMDCVFKNVNKTVIEFPDLNDYVEY